MGPALALAGASGGLEVLSGLFGYFASQDAASTYESRGRMLRAEAEAEAQRYAEQAANFKAEQKVAYLKSGVQLSGSPLDVITHDALIAQENISAIRARGAAEQTDLNSQADQTRVAGRLGLLNSIIGAGSKVATAGYQSSANDVRATYNRRDLSYSGNAGLGSPRGGVNLADWGYGS